MQVIPQFLALVAVVFFMGHANAWTDKEEVHSAFKTCFKEQGIEKPVRGDKRSQVDKKKLHECLVKQGISEETLQQMKERRKAFREARKSCRTETGVKKPEKGKKISKEDRQKIKACLKEKGFEKPKKV